MERRMTMTKIIAYAEENLANSVYLLEDRSKASPYGIHTRKFRDDSYVRYVVAFRGYYEDENDHGHDYEFAYDDFTPAWDAFKEIIENYHFEKVHLCENFRSKYECLYDDGEPYVPSATNGDYGPSNPWDAPGMSVRDFI